MSHGFRFPRLVAVLGAVAIGSAIGLGVDILRVGGLEGWVAARGPHASPPPPPPPYEALGRLVEVDGRDVYLDCRGTGSPTVILENGYLAGAAGWGALLNETAATTRVCAWDRPGIGQSEARGRHSGAATATDLRLALEAAGERGPYVVVAHSLGALYANLFAAEMDRAGDAPVEALILLDGYEPLLGADADPNLDPATRAEIRESIDGTGAMIQGGEDLDWAATLAEVAAIGPIEVETLLMPIEPRARFGDISQPVPSALVGAYERGIAARYPNGRLEYVANSGHVVHFDRPELVAQRVREMVAAVRARAGS